MMQKAVHAAVTGSGFDEASRSLLVLAEGDVSAGRLRRLTERIGNERIAEVDEQTLAYLTMAIPAQKECPIAMAPEVVCIECDGGRIQIRDRSTANTQAKPQASSQRASYWRETKAATLMKMTSKTHDEDPCPMIPGIFINAARMQRLSREIKGFSGQNGPHEPVVADTPNLQENPQPTVVDANELHVSTRPEIIHQCSHRINNQTTESKG